MSKNGEHKMINPQVQISGRERAILAGCVFEDQSRKHVEYSLRELAMLAATAGAVVVEEVLQNRKMADPSFYVGKGKAAEIKEIVIKEEADLVIFNAELSPAQLQRLSHEFPCKVIDRTQLILDIFAQRARSKEGKIQVELAQLQYLLPRLAGSRTSLSKLGGGIGTRGPGETKLETERRYIRKRMNDIEASLANIVAFRERSRLRRKNNAVFQVTLIGYTNAGKSTLLNQLTHSEVYTQNQLFATLDSTIRQCRLPSGLHILLTDTVGFIQDLPTSLIAAFRSTLEEVTEADLIIFVADSTDPFSLEHDQIVHDMIDELGAGHIPVMKVYTKKDLQRAKDVFIAQDDLYISAFHDDDLMRVKREIENHLLQTMVQECLLIPAHKADVIAKCRQQGMIHDLEWQEDHESYKVEMSLYAHHSLAETIAAYRCR